VNPASSVNKITRKNSGCSVVDGSLFFFGDYHNLITKMLRAIFL
jgi:hypothetical protein